MTFRALISKKLRLTTSLQTRITMVIGVLSLLGSSLLFMYLSQFMMTRFGAVEQRLVEKDTKNITARLTNEWNRLASFSKDWGLWDDAYEYMNTKDSEFINSSVGDTVLDELAIDLIGFIDPKGNIIYSGLYDDKTETTIDATTKVQVLIQSHPSLVDHDSSICKQPHICFVDGRPMIIGLSPILKTDGSGPSQGRIFFAKFLTEVFIKNLAAEPQQHVTLSSASASQPLIKTENIKQNEPEKHFIIELIHSDLVVSHTFLHDFDGNHVLTLNLASDRPIHQQALASLWYLAGMCLLLAMSITLIVSLALRKLLINRLLDVVSKVGHIDQSHGTYQKININGHDELSELADAINDMLMRIEESDKNLIASEEQHRTLFESANDAIFVIDQGKLVTCNRKTLEIFNCTYKNIINLSPIEFSPPTQPNGWDSANKAVELVNKALAGQPQRFEWLHQRPDGSLFDGEVSLSQIVINDQPKVLAVVRDITERKKAAQQLEILANQDALTALPNRKILMEQLTQALKRKQSDPAYEVAILFLDLDRFKIINDSLGHEAGDHLLKEFATRLNQTVSLCDWKNQTHGYQGQVMRLGGDEFVVLIEGKGATESAINAAKNIVKLAAEPFELCGHRVHTSVSVGVVANQQNYTDPIDMLRDADIALYRAKHLGKNQFVVFDQAMQEQAMQRLLLENDLRHAVEQKEIEVYYQPIVSLEDGNLTGFEALSRWNHAERGFVSPVDFIPIAEETGLILDLGRQVLITACKQIAKWENMFDYDKPLSVAVNLSRRQLIQPNLIEQVRQVIHDTGIKPVMLKLEITESMVMDNVDSVLPILQQIRDLGVGLSFDDFGTGHSSLSCLHLFPVTTLKIDRAFIANMGNNIEYAAITQAVVTLAHNLNINVIAEGIENPNQLAQLQALECDRAQGYFFAKPMTAQKAEAWIRQGAFDKEQYNWDYGVLT